MDLYICEKGSVAKKLKPLLPQGSDVVALSGHVLRRLMPEEYNPTLKDWRTSVKEGKVPYFPDEYKKVAKETKKGAKGMNAVDYTGKVKEAISKIKSANSIILASDPDEEGANLAVEIVMHADGGKRGSNYKKIKGMIDTSKLDDTSLRKNINIVNKLPWETMSLASEARAIYDWNFGMWLTMVATVELGQGSVLPLGPVKLPILGLIANRDLQFEKFKKLPFYKIGTTLRHKKSGKKFKAQLLIDGKNEFDPNFEGRSVEEASSAEKKRLESLIATIKESAFKVDNYKEETKNKKPPLPCSMSDVQGMASKFGTNMKTVDDTLQELYSNANTSYGRTPLRYLSEGDIKEAPAIIAALGKTTVFKDFTSMVLTDIKPEAYNDKKLEGANHTAIAPLASLKTTITDGSSVEAKVFNFVAARWLAQWLPQYKYLAISVNSNTINTVSFRATESLGLEAGFRVLPYLGGKDEDDIDERTIPQMNDGDELEIVDFEIQEGERKPKPLFTESTLASALENVASAFDDPVIKKHLGGNPPKGIGTPATRSSIIEELFKQGYLEYKNNKKNICTTDKARWLINILPEKVSSPIMRAELEMAKGDIISGKMQFKNFEDIMKKIVIGLFNQIKEIAKEGSDMPELMREIKGSKPPSEKQLKFAKMVAEKTGKELPKGASKDWKVCSDFIEKHKDEIPAYDPDKPRAPSDKQLEFAQKIADTLKIKLPPEAKNDWKVCSDFINQNKEEMPVSGGGKMGPPSEKQLAFAKKIAEDKGLKLPKEASNNWKVCSEFIEKNKG